jgi:hypothetical protein
VVVVDMVEEHLELNKEVVDHYFVDLHEVKELLL